MESLPHMQHVVRGQAVDRRHLGALARRWEIGLGFCAHAALADAQQGVWWTPWHHRSVCSMVNETLLDIEFIEPMFSATIWASESSARVVWTTHPLFGRNTPVWILYNVLQLGTGRTEDAGLHPQRRDYRGRC